MIYLLQQSLHCRFESFSLLSVFFFWFVRDPVTFDYGKVALIKSFLTPG